MYYVSSGVCVSGQCQHNSTWCLMVTTWFVCWLNAGIIIEVFHYEIIISCGFSLCHNYNYIKMHCNIMIASNNTDFCQHFSEYCQTFVSMPEYALFCRSTISTCRIGYYKPYTKFVLIQVPPQLNSHSIPNLNFKALY